MERDLPSSIPNFRKRIVLVYSRMIRNKKAIISPAVVNIQRLPPAVGGFVKFDCVPAGGGMAGTMASPDGVVVAMAADNL